MQMRQDGSRLILTDLPDRKTVGFFGTRKGRRLTLALLLVGNVMHVFGGRFIIWHIPEDRRWLIAALVVAVFAVLELCSMISDRRALTTTFDAVSVSVVQRGSRGLGALERHAPFSAFARIEIADRPAGGWWLGDPQYVLQARLTSGEVWPLTAPSFFLDELAEGAAAIERKLAARV